ncbi:MAG: AMP-binding protein [Candidatus Pacearchaeota archaeon]
MLVNWKKLQREYFLEGKNFVDLIEEFAEKNPSTLALHFEYENGNIVEFSYKEFVEKINQYANFFYSEDIRKSSRVAIFLPKCQEFYFFIFALIKIGAIPMPLFEAFQKEGLTLRLKKGDVNFLITNKELSQRYEKVKSVKKVFLVEELKKVSSNKKAKKHNPKEKDVCLMLFTSSTAGTPVAGIMLPYKGAVQWIYSAKEVLGLEKGKKYFCSAHPGWVTGSIYGVIAPFLVGASVYSLDGRFNDERWLDFLKRNKITNVYSAPTVFRLLKDKIKKGDLNFLERVCSVGEALPKSLVEQYLSLGIKIIDTYWQTEIGSIVIANIPFKLGALGKAVGVNISLKKGEIVLKKPWPSMMVGIYKHEKMYKSYFSGNFFHTKDLAKKDGDGYFYFEGRKDDIIKTSGERVSPLEIENILMKFKGIKECAVVGIPDKERGAILKAFVVLNDKSQASEKLKEEISLFVKNNYAGHSYPKIIEFIDELPKGNSGKILRKKLVEEKIIKKSLNCR